MAQQLDAWRFVAADYYEPFNEPDPPTPAKWQWLDAFTQACLRIADAWGRRLALFAFASGVPEPEELVYLLPSLRLAQAGGHAVGLHEYGLAGSGLLRDNAPHLATRYRQYRASGTDGCYRTPGPNGSHRSDRTDWTARGYRCHGCTRADGCHRSHRQHGAARVHRASGTDRCLWRSGRQ